MKTVKDCTVMKTARGYCNGPSKGPSFNEDSKGVYCDEGTKGLL